MTGIIDYGAGNIRSVSRALDNLDAKHIISSDPEQLKLCDRLLFPGVGEAASAMQSMKSSGLEDFVKEFIQTGKWFFGICLGCQILLDFSEEGSTELLHILPGVVKKFPIRDGYKVPHMGWNQVRFIQSHPIFSSLKSDNNYYFVHSFYTTVETQNSYAETEYGFSFTSAFGNNNIFAVQFHPEKSGLAGIKMLDNFIKL